MNNCDGCKLYKPNITNPICIPRPSRTIQGCIISRDPTKEFLPHLIKYKQLAFNQKDKKNLWFDAPPRWLCDKIENFMNFDKNPQKMHKLRSFLDNQCYWTHLHKCPTCKPNKNQNKKSEKKAEIIDYYPPFKYRIAKVCAEKWFEFEFDKYDLRDKVIIACGRDVERFLLSQWSKQHLDIPDNNIINLPHPSDANCGNGWSWNKNTIYKNDIIDEINRLFNLI